MVDVGGCRARNKACREGLAHFFRFLGGDDRAFNLAAVFDPDDGVLRHVDKTAGEVTGVGGTERGVGQAFAPNPCVEMKYSSTSMPSLNDFLTGSSMMSPDGLDTGPFMPTICVSWDQLPRAPDSTIENTGPDLFICSLESFHDLILAVHPDLDDLVVALGGGEQAFVELLFDIIEQGMKNRDIGRELGIRPGTVKIHLKHIFEKTGIRGRYGLALSGLREKGLLSLPAA